MLCFRNGTEIWELEAGNGTEEEKELGRSYVLICVPSKFTCWSLKSQYLRLWLHFKIGPLKRYSNYKAVRMSIYEEEKKTQNRYQGCNALSEKRPCEDTGKPASTSQTVRPAKKTNLPAPWLWTSGFWNWETIHFCCLSPVCGILLWQP